MAHTDPKKDTSALPVIAVGFDGSVPAAAALDWAALEARRTGATLRVISVVDYPGLHTGTPESAPILPASLLNRANKVSAEAASRARKVLDSGKLETQIVIGAAAEALVTATQSVRLLVVGNRGRSDLASTVLGSVSFAVTAHAHCPVVVGEGSVLVGPQHGVVVGVDGSCTGDRALDLTADLAAHAGASHDAGLVVVGSRGLGGFTGLVLGLRQPPRHPQLCVPCHGCSDCSFGPTRDHAPGRRDGGIRNGNVVGSRTRRATT